MTPDLHAVIEVYKQTLWMEQSERVFRIALSFMPLMSYLRVRGFDIGRSREGNDISLFVEDVPEIYGITVGAWRSQWPRGLRRRSEAARLLRLWVRIPAAVWTFVGCECCQLQFSATS